MSEEGVGNGRRAAEARRWLKRSTKVRPVSEVCEGLKSAEIGGDG